MDYEQFEELWKNLNCKELWSHVVGIQPKPVTEDCREAFEAWLKGQGFSTVKNTDGTYLNRHENRWEGWQSAWNLRHTEQNPVTDSTVDTIAEILESRLMIDHIDALEIAIDIVEKYS